MKLSQRFILLFITIIIGFVTYGAWSFKVINDSRMDGPIFDELKQLQDLKADSMPPTVYAIGAYIAANKIYQAKSQEQVQAQLKLFESAMSDYHRDHQKWLEKESERQEILVFISESIHQPIETFSKIVTSELIPTVKTELESSIRVSDKRDEIFSRVEASFDAHKIAVDNLIVKIDELFVSDRAAASKEISAALSVLVIVFVIFLVIIAITITLISRKIMSQLGGDPAYVSNIVEKIASGNLAVDIRVNHSDRTSLLSRMVSMRDNLISIVKQIQLSSDTINNAMLEINSGNQDLSRRTEDEVALLEETSVSMTELTETVRANAETAASADALATQAVVVVEQGTVAMNDTIATVNRISESANKINDITALIEGIAFQTNILALNAAVEAARAGEQGRGFAVVANEVRTLAQRSSNAAKDIKQLIDSSVEMSQLGVEKATSVGENMDKIKLSINDVSHMINQIATASNEQRQGIEQANVSIARMDSTTQQNAALVEQATQATANLDEQLQNLQRAITRFKLEPSMHDDLSHHMENTSAD